MDMPWGLRLMHTILHQMVWSALLYQLEEPWIILRMNCQEVVDVRAKRLDFYGFLIP